MTAGSLTILGGGVAGLAAGYFAARRGLPFTLLEAGDEVGGNCRTLSLGPFRFDTGAHRFHDQDPARHAGDPGAPGRRPRPGLRPEPRVPAGPARLVPAAAARPRAQAGAGDDAAGCPRPGPRPGGRGRGAGTTSRAFAVRTYGRTIAREFLLDYSAKLWGAALLAALAARRRTAAEGPRPRARSCSRPFAAAAPRRPTSTARSSIPAAGSAASPSAWPTRPAATASAAARGSSACSTTARAIRAVGVAGRAPEPCDAVVSTLSLPRLVRLFDPPAAAGRARARPEAPLPGRDARRARPRPALGDGERHGLLPVPRDPLQPRLRAAQPLSRDVAPGPDDAGRGASRRRGARPGRRRDGRLGSRRARPHRLDPRAAT